uniref:Transmembrane protein n=1 Tax=Meloidogyne floridensis TaxID=298350 RepID=A0A915P853_9BILA
MPSNLENVNIEASPQRNGYNCLTSLTIFVLSASSSLKYFQTIYNPLNQAGQLNFEQVPQKLSFTYSVSCAGGISKDGRRLMGPGCDLNCNTTSITSNNAICENVKTGYFSQCKWTNGGNLDVTNCQNCPFGVKNNAYCADEQGGVLYGVILNLIIISIKIFFVKEVVSTFYYNGFIILCLVSGILFVLLNSKQDNNQNKFHSSKRSNESALLKSTFNNRPELIPLNSSKEETKNNNIKIIPPSYNKNEINLNPPPPSPFPRSINASTASIPNDIVINGQQQQRFPVIQNGGKLRKTLSPPRFQPLPHLGPQADNNIVNNSNFASRTGTPILQNPFIELGSSPIYLSDYLLYPSSSSVWLSRATIWQIGLFQRLEGNNKEAICKLCIENKEKKYTFSVNNFTTTNLVYHLKSKHKNTEFYKLFFKLEKEKESKKIKCEEDFNNKLAQKIEEQTEDDNGL